MFQQRAAKIIMSGDHKEEDIFSFTLEFVQLRCLKLASGLLTAAGPLVLVLAGQGKQLVCWESGWYVPFLHETQLLRVPLRYDPENNSY